MNRARWFILVVAAQAAFLLGWAGYHEWNRATATVILLETTPVDPRDLLRGDYMILGYKIGRVPRPAAEPAGSPAHGAAIWVTLRQNGRFHEAVETAWSEPSSVAPGAILVRGRVMSGMGDAQLRVEYDIEKYFVPEGKGQPRFREMVVEATVSTAHRLGIKRVLIDGVAYP